MKKAFLLLLFPLLSFSQEIEKDYIDEFTKEHIISTKFEELSTNTCFIAFRIVKRDLGNILNLKMIFSTDPIMISEKDKIMIMFSDNTIKELYPERLYTSCRGCGAIGLRGSNAPGFNVYYGISLEDIDDFKNKNIIKIRLNTSYTYRDTLVKEKQSNLFKDTFSLVYKNE